MKSVFLYDSHIEFLSDRYNYFKSIYPYFSHRFISNKWGKKSSSFFYHILKGDIKISDEMIDTLCLLFKLEPVEARFFTFLVYYNQSDSVHIKSYYLENELKQMRGEKA